MTVGEIDFEDTFIDTIGKNSTTTNNPLNPFPEASFVFISFFLLLMTIILMNLLVGNETRVVCWHDRSSLFYTQLKQDTKLKPEKYSGHTRTWAIPVHGEDTSGYIKDHVAQRDDEECIYIKTKIVHPKWRPLQKTKTTRSTFASLSRDNNSRYAMRAKD